MKRTYHILNMECPSCAARLEALEDEIAGVQQIDANYRKGEMVVEYEEGKMDEAVLLAAVKRLGYDLAA
jgi:copper chaperone CopZ